MSGGKTITGNIVNEGSVFYGSIVIQDNVIQDIISLSDAPQGSLFILPGVIDTHVHFREPGLTAKANMASESQAAKLGGVTSVFDMPNCAPTTTTQEALNQKFTLAKEKFCVNYSFFPGATNDNIEFLRSLDPKKVPGIKLFMGSSTGNMLVDQREALEQIFALAAEKGLIIMAHCEDTTMINNNLAKIKAELNTDDPDIKYHPIIRSAEACYESAKLGAELARKYGTRFHIAHITTARELELLGGNVTGEACVAHLLFDDSIYNIKGSRVKCNPAIKTREDRDALRQAVANGVISTISTDHAPHQLSDKEGGASKAASGMPMVQFSLPAILTLAEEINLPITKVVELMAHNPAKLFKIQQRGFIRKGYKADLTIVEREPWQVTTDCIASICGWSPLEGETLNWKVKETLCSSEALIFQN